MLHGCRSANQGTTATDPAAASASPRQAAVPARWPIGWLGRHRHVGITNDHRGDPSSRPRHAQRLAGQAKSSAGVARARWTDSADSSAAATPARRLAEGLRSACCGQTVVAEHRIHRFRGQDTVRPVQQSVDIGGQDALSHGLARLDVLALDLSQQYCGLALLAALLHVSINNGLHDRVSGRGLLQQLAYLGFVDTPGALCSNSR